MSCHSPGPLLGFLLLHAIVGSAWLSPTALVKQLLNETYDPTVPPHQAVAGWRMSHARTVVTFNFFVEQFRGADLETGSITVFAQIKLTWNDPRLAYNGTEVFGPTWARQKRIALPTVQGIPGTSHVWTPSVVSPFQGNFMSELAASDVQVAENGGVDWIRFGTLTIPAEEGIDLRKFPYGSAIIEAHFYDAHQIDLVTSAMDSGMRFRVGEVSGDSNSDRLFQFRLSVRNASVWHYDVDVDMDFGMDFDWAAHAVYNVDLKRSDIAVAVVFQLEFIPFYYIANIIFPVGFMVVFQTFGLWMPLEDLTDRISYSATIVLTVVAIVLFTAEARPATPYLTYLDHFQALAFLLCFLPLLSSVFLRWLQKATEKPETKDGDHTQLLRRLEKGAGITAEGLDAAQRYTYPWVVTAFCVWTLKEGSTAVSHLEKTKEGSYTLVFLILQMGVMSINVVLLLLASFTYIAVRFLRKYCVRYTASPASWDGAGGAEGEDAAAEQTHAVQPKDSAGGAEGADSATKQTAAVQPEVGRREVAIAVNQEGGAGGAEGADAATRQTTAVQPEVLGNPSVLF